MAGRDSKPVLAPPSGQFIYPKLGRVIFGPGKVTTLEDELERLARSRVLVVTGTTLGRSPLIKHVTSAIGSRLAGVFTEARQHVPRATTEQLAARIQQLDIDCLVSFGGGSPIDTAKVAIHALLASGRELLHIALPTTLSAGEYTAAAGVTDEATRVKRGVRDPRLLARTVINDPELTLETPEHLWNGTGMRALDHAVETIYSRDHQPLCDTLASRAIALLVEHLRASTNAPMPEQVAHRGHCQMAAWFSIFSAGNVRMGISHALGHQIGPRWNVPHGVTSCITLPHVMRLMAEIAPERFEPIAAGFGLEFDRGNTRESALACADQAAEFIAGFGLATSLEAAGVPGGEIDQIVEPVVKEIEHNQSVGLPITREQVVALLEAAWPAN